MLAILAKKAEKETIEIIGQSPFGSSIFSPVVEVDYSISAPNYWQRLFILYCMDHN